MAGLHKGYILECPLIRVDSFGEPPEFPRPPWLLPVPREPSLPPRPAPPARLFLLTHVHTDHLTGLTGAFVGRIVCTPETKKMLLKLEQQKSRENVHKGVQEVPRKLFEGLRPRPVDPAKPNGRNVDCLITLEYGRPTLFNLGHYEGKDISVTITALEANHCPGSAMHVYTSLYMLTARFLITSPDFAVLHTGDVRSDRRFMENLRRAPSVQDFLHPTFVNGSQLEGPLIRRTLDRIYLDTSCFLGTTDMPEKEHAVERMLENMALFPPETVFFFDIDIFGWEDVVMAVARQYNAPIHVDRYKHEIYRTVESMPFLTRCVTTDPHATRFHACDSNLRCQPCNFFDPINADKLIVTVTMSERRGSGWDIRETEKSEKLRGAACGEGHWPRKLAVPYARHSTLPELQALVSLFRPLSISPHSFIPSWNMLDYFTLAESFSTALSDEAVVTVQGERDQWFDGQTKFGPDWRATMAQGVAHEVYAEARENERTSASHPFRSQHNIHDTRGARAIDHIQRVLQEPSYDNNGPSPKYQRAVHDGDDQQPLHNVPVRMEASCPLVPEASNVLHSDLLSDRETSSTTMMLKRSPSPSPPRPKAPLPRRSQKFGVDKSHLRYLAIDLKPEPDSN